MVQQISLNKTCFEKGATLEVFPFYKVHKKLRNSNKISLNKTKGFTLIEILIALVILSGFILSLGKMKAGNQKSLKKIEHYSKVTQLMESKISELEFEWRKKNFDNLPREAKGDFKEEKHFSWSVATQPLSLPDPELFLKATGQKAEGMALQIAQVTEQFLSQAVLELKLTIHYKKGKLKSAYSMTTYIVDHNKKIQLTGGL